MIEGRAVKTTRNKMAQKLMLDGIWASKKCSNSQSQNTRGALTKLPLLLACEQKLDSKPRGSYSETTFHYQFSYFEFKPSGLTDNFEGGLQLFLFLTDFASNLFFPSWSRLDFGFTTHHPPLIIHYRLTLLCLPPEICEPGSDRNFLKGSRVCCNVLGLLALELRCKLSPLEFTHTRISPPNLNPL